MFLRIVFQLCRSYQSDYKNEPFRSDGRSKWFREVTKTITKVKHSPATGAQNGFEKLPKRSQNSSIPQRWALEMVSKSYQNEHKNEPLPSDGRSKWFRKVPKRGPEARSGAGTQPDSRITPPQKGVPRRGPGPEPSLTPV